MGEKYQYRALPGSPGSHGETIITNAVLGMRRSDSVVGEPTKAERYTGMITWWLPLVQELKSVKVFLCGEWAITPLDLPDPLDSMPKGIAEGELGSNIDVKCLPHPGGWGRVYESCH
jgi:hypothetical protein